MQQRKAIRRDDPQGPRLERTGSVVRIRSLAAGRQLLRERHRTTQAGFTAEKIPKGFLKHHPILISDGPLHDEQRTKVGRFFAPKVVAERYPGLMADSADRLLAGVEGELLLDDLALLYSVEVTAKVVGLTESPVEKMAGRLTTFFNQPPFDITKPDLGRTGKQWAAAAVNGLVPVARFYVRDVRPAVRARRKEPRGDVISHLIAEGYTNADILIECVTYGTAGMVTTREFICMAAWHLLTDEDLRSRYEAGEERDRIAVLNEIIRLEPVVGHLYRRVSEPFTVTDGEHEVDLAAGDLVDVCVRHTNTDPGVVGDAPHHLRPGRELPRGVDPSVLTFGDGAHRCPGQPLAITETDVLLTRLLRLGPEVLSEPEVGWDDLIEGYRLRGLVLRTTPRAGGTP